MYCKALLFRDVDMARRIEAARTAKEAKALGRKVRGFREARWISARWNIMYACVLAKFRTNKALQTQLLRDAATGPFVEASSYDDIWGIGYGEREALSHRDDWGLNLLGKVTDAVARTILKEGDDREPHTLQLHAL